MNFYETNAGHRFFEHQLPLLITSLQDIAKALQKTPMGVQLPVEVPPDFLKDLYYGRYDQEAEKNMGKIKEHTHDIIECQKRLKEQVTPQLWEQIEEYRHALDNLYYLDAEESFVSGFQTAMKMVIAGLSSSLQSE
ncbi:DUF6809 family protein [Anaerocolumna xylanovorans]|uniref:Uncharacterized protein n=1 Tax=Anaerocolumna xylanovorans DSM 12503 TaxID=1121345 RepID=A0A1M7YNG7_9FIRM|nr:DUF6809 family protein [Anaerocolumna xylanovorans]SHO54159.1 hypothetical protein SAMN02745217_04614 [Anaerocolumna xylanovorans DSM 12503]